MSELGYLPNLAASSLASASSYTIAMVVPSLSESGCAEMFAGLQKVLQPAGYHIMLAESQHHLEREEKLLETLLSYNLAAAVLLSVEHSQNARNALIAANIPVVEIGAVRADPIDMSIGIDYVAAMYQLTQTVIASGYQNIGLLCANQEQWIFQQHLAQGAAAQPYVAASGDQRRAARQLQHRRAAAAGIPAGLAGAGRAGVRLGRTGRRRAV